MTCECVRCDTCKGFGSIHDPFDYSGCPDERCMDCDGSGLEYECDDCMMAREDEYERSPPKPTAARWQVTARAQNVASPPSNKFASLCAKRRAFARCARWILDSF